jgi:hypothetical protein
MRDFFVVHLIFLRFTGQTTSHDCRPFTNTLRHEQRSEQNEKGKTTTTNDQHQNNTATLDSPDSLDSRKRKRKRKRASTYTTLIFIMASKLKNIPPDVLRELRRHVSAKPLPRPEVAAKELAAQHKTSLNRLMGACVLLVGTAGSFPLVAHWWMGGLSEKEEALTAPQVRRGAFLNSGTKDIGRDPNWDFTKGHYKKDAGYWAIFQEEKKQMPGEFLAMPSDKLKKHEEELKAFATGQIKQNGKPSNYQL